MPITLRLPQPAVSLEIGQAAFRAQRLAQTLSMAFALQLRGDARPHWLGEAIKELNDLCDLLKLEQDVTVQLPSDPVDALFERANVIALSQSNGQVLR